MAKYKDREKTRSQSVGFRPGEHWKDRHERRKNHAAVSSEACSLWAEANGVTFRVTNEGHHFQFRQGGEEDADHCADWWPSSAKLVLCQRWKQGIHAHDVETVLRILEGRWLRMPQT